MGLCVEARKGLNGYSAHSMRVMSRLQACISVELCTCVRKRLGSCKECMVTVGIASVFPAVPVCLLTRAAMLEVERISFERLLV